MKPINSTQKRKMDRLKKKAAEKKADKERNKGRRNSAGRVGSPNLRDAAKQVQRRKKKIKNQVNSNF